MKIDEILQIACLALGLAYRGAHQWSWHLTGRILEGFWGGRGGHQLGLEGGMRWTLVSGKGKGSPHMERDIEACCLLITVPLPTGPPEAEEGPRAKSDGALSQQNSSPPLPHHSHQHPPPQLSPHSISLPLSNEDLSVLLRCA